MEPTGSAPTKRFTDRVGNYARYRPGYPPEVIQTLARDAGLLPSSAVADVGSGTGISAELFLDYGCTVYANEPNAAMRSAAEERLGKNPRFVSSDGTAESTGLEDHNVDFVTAAQAFHWFNRAQARREFQRILRTDGWIVLLWNTRLTDATPLLRAYEDLLLKYATDYAQVRHDAIGDVELGAFFGGAYQSRTFANEQIFDFEGLKGRLLSSSYAPQADDPRHGPMLFDLRQIFQSHEENGHVRMLYETRLYFGRLGL